MFKKLVKSLYAVPALLATTAVAFAQPVSTTSVKSSNSVAILADGQTFYRYGVNMFIWVGGFMVAAAVLGGFGLMAWQAFSGDDDAAKVAQKWFPRIVLAGFAGVLLLAGPSILTFASTLIGGSAPTSLDASAFGN